MCYSGALSMGRANACDNLVGRYIFRVPYSSLFSYYLSALCIWVIVCNCSLFTIRGMLEKYPTFGREKETGLLGALDT